MCWLPLTLEHLDEDEKKKILEKAYGDCWFVLLRNGGMLQKEDGSKRLVNLFWKYFPYNVLIGYTVFLFLLLTSLYVERRSVDNFLEAAHYSVMIISLGCGNVDFLYYRKDLDILLRQIGMGFFRYDEEELEIHNEMKRATVREVKMLSQAGVLIYSFMAFTIAVVQPLIYYMAVRGEPIVKSTMNHFLPVPMYMPWDTFTMEGFTYAYIIQLLGTIFVVSNVMANGFSYVNLMVMFRCQLQILNHSVRNIEQRATTSYRKRYGILPDTVVIKNELEINENLRKCFRDCLRQNIMHHQCLLRWEVKSRKMLRVILLFVFFNASILIASTGYLLVKNLHSKVRTIKFVQLLVCEIFHTFLYCFYGEQIIKQSEDLFDNLYNMGWFKYGKEFNSLLLVMMTVTVKPIRSLTAIFNTPCSLETFNALMSTAYSYFSLINGMKDNL